MKRFLLLFSGFAGLFALVVSLFLIAGNIAASRDQLYLTNTSKKIFLFGHSRTAYAYNDSLMQGVRNFANEAEPYFFTYPKLKKVLDANPQVKTIVVELSDIHMQPLLTEEWTYHTDYLKYHLPNYGQLLSTKQHLFLFKKNPKAYLQSLPVLMRYNLRFMLHIKSSLYGTRNFGGYKVHDSSKLINNQTDHIRLKQGETKARVDDLQYLDRIVKYCNKKSINLIFLRSPVHVKFGMKEYEALWIQKYLSRYSSYPVINLSYYPLPDTAFYDYHHLNKYGAKIISPKLDSALSVYK